MCNSTRYYIIELPCPSTTSSHCWISASNICVTFSKVSIMSRYMVQPCVPPSILLWPTSLWKSLKAQTSTLPLTPQCFCSVDDTFLFRRQTSATSSYRTSTPLTLTYNLLQRVTNSVGSIPFLDTVVKPGPDNTLLTTIYRNLLTKD